MATPGAALSFRIGCPFHTLWRVQSPESLPSTFQFIRRIPAAVLDRLVCASAGLLSFVVYLVSMPPSVTGEDSGELVAAAYTLGIPHPPGYPLWTMFAYGVTHAFPIGTVAWRAAALSALFAALTVWMLAELLLYLFDRRDVAWVSAMAFGISREFWQQSVVAEIYTLGALLLLAAICLTVAWYHTRRRAALYAAAAVAGLAGAHYTLNLLLLPIMMLFVLATDVRPRRWRAYWIAVLWTLPGWLIYLYLPLRSAANPAVDWGDPTNIQRFWDVLTRGQYAHLLSTVPRTWENFGEQSLYFARFIAFEYTPWVGLLAFPGIVAFWQRDRSLGAFFAASFVVFAVGGIVVPNFPTEYHWMWVNTPYWIPATMTLVVFLAATLAWLMREVNWPRNVPALGAVLLLASLAAWNGPQNYRRGDTTVLDYASDVLETLAPNAVYFGGGDHTVFPLMYLKIVEGRRPDVLIANRYGYPAAELYALVGEHAPSTRPSEAEEERLFASALAVGRPVYSVVPRLEGSRRMVYEGLLYRFVRADEAYVADADWSDYHWPARGTVNTRGDWSNELVAYEYFSARGRLLLAHGDEQRGTESLKRAEDFIHDDKTAWNNIGIAFGRHGLLNDASESFSRALDSDPEFVPALMNLARCRLEQGDAAGAIALLDRAAAAGADSATVAEMKLAASGSDVGDERRETDY